MKKAYLALNIDFKRKGQMVILKFKHNQKFHDPRRFCLKILWEKYKMLVSYHFVFFPQYLPFVIGQKFCLFLMVFSNAFIIILKKVFSGNFNLFVK